jgi:aspergillopepsin I
LQGVNILTIEIVQPQSVTTFFQNAIALGVLQEPVFTADLKKGAPGSYDFGFIDPTKYNGDITYVP